MVQRVANEKDRPRTKDRDLSHGNTSNTESLCQLNFVAVDKDRPILSYLCACYIRLHSSPKQGDTLTCNFSFLLPFLDAEAACPVV